MDLCRIYLMLDDWRPNHLSMDSSSVAVSLIDTVPVTAPFAAGHFHLRRQTHLLQGRRLYPAVCHAHGGGLSGVARAGVPAGGPERVVLNDGPGWNGAIWEHSPRIGSQAERAGPSDTVVWS
jgi:hypothetical protein